MSSDPSRPDPSDSAPADTRPKNPGLPRPVIAVGVALALLVPAAIGYTALRQAEEATSLAALALEQAAEADAPPLDLVPPTSASEPDRPAELSSAAADLRALAEADPQGAVALVRQALLADPSILEEAIAALEVSRTQDEAALMAGVIAENAEALFDEAHASVMGNPQGSITLVEFLDYNCGFCKRAHIDVMRLIEQYDELRVLVKDFPVLGPGSLEAAQMAIAYRETGGDMTAFIDRMMAEEDAPADTALARAVALELGADEAALNAALEDPGLMESIGEAYALAEALNIRGTPAFVIGEQRVIGAVGFDRLNEAIQAEVARQDAP